MNSNYTLIQFKLLGERLDKLEKKVFKSNRIPATLAQQILLLQHTKLLDQMDFLTKTLKSKFISILLDEDEKNINQYLNYWAKKDRKIRNMKNYEFLVDTFDSLELKNERIECQAILTELQNQIETK